MPPDGFTFSKDTTVGILGNAWMALPLTEAKDGPIVPTGDLSWTLFLNASNFNGPVAFYIPETWSRLSRGYRTIIGRGLDARPGRMGGGAMEVNTVPYIEGEDDNGIKYSKVPKLNFPVDENGITILMQDVKMYSKDALYNDIKSWSKGGDAPSGKFNLDGAWTPQIESRPITFRQGRVNVPLTGFEAVVKTEIFGDADSQAFGLQWVTNDNKGIFPQYYKQEGEQRVVVFVDQVPEDTKLLSQRFRLKTIGDDYTSPKEKPNSWTEPGPKTGPFKITLSDGSEVTYSWYRFIDQPSLQKLGWTGEEKERLQALVEKIHANWLITGEYMPPPSRGALVKLDPVLCVEPPNGLEVGYVPIVTSQTKSSR